jgi:hypothetical protein
VYSNDPSSFGNPNLTVRATIQVPVLISPKQVFLVGRLNDPLSSAVEVRGELEAPLELTPLQFDLEGKVQYEIVTVEQGRSYRIVFTASADKPTNFIGTLKLKTNYPEQPEIVIPVMGKFLPLPQAG